MKRLLILGCNEITKRLLLELCENKTYASGICLASRHKEECDELKKLAESKGVRVTTSGIDVSNAEGAMMMIKIIAPEVVINLLPPELSIDAMNLAIKANASYIDGKLFGVPPEPSSTSLLSEQFTKFSDFQKIQKTAVCGAGMMPGAIATIVKKLGKQTFSRVKNVDICVVKGVSGSGVRTEEKDDSDVLYSEDIRPLTSNLSIGTKHPVFYVENNLPKAAEAFSVEKKSSNGTSVFLSNSPIISDLIKEIPEVGNARFFEPGIKPDEHVAPKAKIDILRDLGLLSDNPVKVGSVSIAPIDLVAEVLPKMSAPARLKDRTSEVLSGEACYEIYITGENGGDISTRLFKIALDNNFYRKEYGVSASDYIEGTVIIEAVKLMCNDKWMKSGVYTPAAFNSELLYNAMISAGIEIKESDSSML